MLPPGVLPPFGAAKWQGILDIPVSVENVSWRGRDGLCCAEDPRTDSQYATATLYV
jgi:hypothetical protein